MNRFSLSRRLSLRTWIGIGLATLSLTVFFPGCAAKVFTWNEEVQLDGGQVIVVRRTISFKEYQPLGGGGGGSDILDSTLAIESPGIAGAPDKWSNPPLIPMILDRDKQTNEWFIVTTFYMCTAWYDLGRPKLPYAEFRYRQGQWVRQPLSDHLIGRQANLLVPNQRDVTGDHTLSSKHQIMSDPTMSSRHKLVVSTWRTNC